MALRKPLDANMPNDLTTTDPTGNGTAKKSSNMTATTSDGKTSEIESIRKISKDQSAAGATDTTG